MFSDVAIIWTNFCAVLWIRHNTPRRPRNNQNSGWTWSKRGQTESASQQGHIYLDACSVIHIYYLEKGKPITGKYYSKLLYRFCVDLKQKRPVLVKKKVLFRQDNARVHTCLVTMIKIHELGYEFSSSIFSRLSPLRLYSVSKPKEIAGW